jgi:hypothetical protein
LRKDPKKRANWPQLSYHPFIQQDTKQQQAHRYAIIVCIRVQCNIFATVMSQHVRGDSCDNDSEYTSYTVTHYIMMLAHSGDTAYTCATDDSSNASNDIPRDRLQRYTVIIMASYIVVASLYQYMVELMILHAMQR